jgi:Ca2+-binding EF-hand superfamily protein
LAFKSLNIDSDGFVLVKDLIDVLISNISLSGSAGVKLPVNLSSDELKKLIPGIDSMSPRTRSQNFVNHFIKELNNKNMKPLSVFNMADTTNTGITSISNLETAFRKLFPNYKYEIIQELMQAFKSSVNKDTVKREDFETLFQEE